MGLTFTIETEREEDGRWIADDGDSMVYGNGDEATVKVQALALRVLAERLYGEVGSEEFVAVSLRHEQ